jgi:hypothetical protein
MQRETAALEGEVVATIEDKRKRKETERELREHAKKKNKIVYWYKSENKKKK